MTEIWYECPKCKKEITLDWDTLSIAGDFSEHILCKCKTPVNIHFTVTEEQHCGHPLSAIVTTGEGTNYCSTCADGSLRANIAAGVEA